MKRLILPRHAKSAWDGPFSPERKPAFGGVGVMLALAFWATSAAWADEVAEIVYDAAPRWQVERTSDPLNGSLLSCELGMGGDGGVIYLKQKAAKTAMVMFPIAGTDEVREVILADSYVATVTVDGNEILTTPPDSTYATLVKEDAETLLVAIADGSRMTVRFEADTGSADITFGLKGSGKAVAAYRDCLSGGGSSPGDTAVTVSDDRSFPAPVGWTVQGTKFSDPAQARYSLCTASVSPEGAPFQVEVTALASGARYLSARSYGAQPAWSEPVLTLASLVKLPLPLNEDGTRGEMTFREGQDAAFEAVLGDLAKDGVLVLSDAKAGVEFTMQVDGAALGIASLRDCMAFIAG
jgi:hypothetical protein